MMASSTGETDTAASSGLVRRLGLGTATALVVGEVIGVGIFLTPAGMAKTLGSPFWLLSVWLMMGVAAVGGAVCYGTLAAMYPEAGGTYVYLREVYGHRTAFLYGWLSLLVTDPASRPCWLSDWHSTPVILLRCLLGSSRQLPSGALHFWLRSTFLGFRLAPASWARSRR